MSSEASDFVCIKCNCRSSSPEPNLAQYVELKVSFWSHSWCECARVLYVAPILRAIELKAGEKCERIYIFEFISNRGGEMEWDFFALIKTEHKRFLSVLFSFRFFSYISFFPVSFLHECELYGTSRIECVTNNNLSPQCKWEKAIHHHIFVCQTHMYLSLGYVRRGEFSAKHWSFFFCCCEPTVHTLTASRWPNCGAVILPFDRTRMWMGRRSKKWWTKKKTDLGDEKYQCLAAWVGSERNAHLPISLYLFGFPCLLIQMCVNLIITYRSDGKKSISLNRQPVGMFFIKFRLEFLYSVS